jgi:hypothetical protein
MKEEYIIICIPVDEKDANQPKEFENGRLIYYKDRNLVIYPMEKVLPLTTYRKSRGVVIFASAKACNHCEHRCHKAYSPTK